ncbi:hypothetical protein SynBIOSE41_04125 [Synechococcus sp. BIOS-E4-1]|nr:hypothetical protein SynBIOSE41_04125 [Synechococcus sp. BIOS-E4-1]
MVEQSIEICRPQIRNTGNMEFRWIINNISQKALVSGSNQQLLERLQGEGFSHRTGTSSATNPLRLVHAERFN